ncbi:hypothetical protein MUN89_10095 [Halobacillus salinarum]|uniref:Uncharacterized protein n=1 Tax=Halobacillus salinarum TaxID=2932257 RepID=A0ABY4EP29_9BACI|nr:hypothetical protein [Halobacillus salinarum]UOQ46224.1 hypothetical protein MUN89_10095 [Halobacillus salinarum]
MREDMERIFDQRDFLVKENKKLKEEVAEEKRKVALLEKTIEENLHPSKADKLKITAQQSQLRA